MNECLQFLDKSISRVLDALPEDDNVAHWVREYAVNHRYRLAHDLALVRRHADRGAKILEFGSAPFFLTLALQDAGYDVCGLDRTPEHFRKVVDEATIEIHKVDFEREPPPVPDDTYDLVLFNEVFEHLRLDLVFTMSQVRRVLKDDGTLLLSTPNHRSLVGIWTLLWHRRGCHVCPDLYEEHNKVRTLGHMGHVREYTPTDVSHFLERIGLPTRHVLYRYYRQPCGRPVAMAIRDRIERVVGTVMPSLRPLFSVVCGKGKPIP